MKNKLTCKLHEYGIKIRTKNETCKPQKLKNCAKLRKKAQKTSQNPTYSPWSRAVVWPRRARWTGPAWCASRRSASSPGGCSSPAWRTGPTSVCRCRATAPPTWRCPSRGRRTVPPPSAWPSAVPLSRPPSRAGAPCTTPCTRPWKIVLPPVADS